MMNMHWKAFEVNALDYLMKPVEPRRLADALQKLQQAEEKKLQPAMAGINRGMFTETTRFL